MDENGQVEGGWQVEGVGGGKEGVGVAATVWDGEVVLVRGGKRGQLYRKNGKGRGYTGRWRRGHCGRGGKG